MTVENAGTGYQRKFERIRVDPTVFGGAPFISGAFGPVTVSRVIEAVANGLSTTSMLLTLPGLSEEDLQEALQYAAAAIRLGTFPPDQRVADDPDVRQLALNAPAWDRVTTFLRGAGMLVTQIPSNRLSADELPCYVVTPGPSIHLARPWAPPEREPIAKLHALAAALGEQDTVLDVESMTLAWSGRITLDGGVISLEIEIDARSLDGIDMTFVVALGRALAELRSLRGPRTS